VLASAAPVTHLEFAMNIELDEVVVQDVSDDALELAAGGAQGGNSYTTNSTHCFAIFAG
jgi:hypothetical protein